MNWDRVERLLGAENLQRLAQKCVAVIGLGSGGGQVALSLAMSGVGRFVLIDDDVLEETNIPRHVADRRYLGQPKAAAVADLILHRNPQAQAEVRVGRVEQHLDALDGADILVVAVDGENTKYAINQVALERGLVAVYAGVYERGEGGDAVVIHPYDGPCYACWAAELREDVAAARPGPEADLDYGMIGPGGTLEAEPGLWLHVTRVAGVQAHLTLNELLKGTDAYEPMPGNTVIVANTTLEIVAGYVSPPHTAVWVSIRRNPDCLVCGDALRARATLAADETAEHVSLAELMHTMDIDLQEEDED